MRAVFRCIAALAALCPAVVQLGTQKTTGAALAVVLAIDVSASVDANSFVLQRNGIARAFEDRRLAQAIAVVPGGIEALLLEWSDPAEIAIAVDWRQIADAQSAAAFAGAVRAAARSSRGLTAIGPALAGVPRPRSRIPSHASGSRRQDRVMVRSPPA